MNRAGPLLVAAAVVGLVVYVTFLVARLRAARAAPPGFEPSAEPHSLHGAVGIGPSAHTYVQVNQKEEP